MTWYRVGPAGIPGSLKTDMDAVLNKKFGTSTTYAPNTWPDNVNLLGPLPEKTATGAIAHIEDGADGVPLKNWLVTLPASLDGYTEVNAVRSGKNLLPNKTYQRNVNTLRLGTDTLDGRLSLKAGTYTLSVTSDVVIGTLTYTIDGTSTGIPFTSSGTRYYGSFTLSADTDDFFVHVYKSGGITAENVSDFMLEVGSTATSYEAYSAPTQYTASLGRTIYGGQADIVTGEGVDYGLWVNMSDIAWTEDPNRLGVFYGSVAGRKTASSASPSDVLGCTCYEVYNSGVSTSKDKYISGYWSYGGGSIFFRDSAFSGYTRAQVQEALEGEKVCVISATPTPFTFTPIQADTELGVNNFWAVEGDSEVTYRADIDLALNA